jgi:hypothetical protein
MLTTREIDPAVPSRNPRLGDGEPAPESLRNYAEMYPGRGLGRLPAGMTGPGRRWGSGVDLGYVYSHKIG